ncbi:MAG: hypothetical protein LBR15_02970 [Methanobrevibacter sp.]|jgi:hypothetical protein|nr:hypothetical protein [Candidatus Methanovirga australis]
MDFHEKKLDYKPIDKLITNIMYEFGCDLMDHYIWEISRLSRDKDVLQKFYDGIESSGVIDPFFTMEQRLDSLNDFINIMLKMTWEGSFYG